MRYRTLLIVILALSLSMLACSLSSESASKSNATRPATLVVTAVAAEPTADLVIPTSTPLPTSTPVPTATPFTADLGIVGGSGADSAAITNISDIQNIETQFYVPGCTPRTDWMLYTVVAGDTLAGIAQRYNTSWQTLADANCLANPSLIYVGQGLHVPTPTNPPNTNPNPPIIDYSAEPSIMDCNVFTLHPSQTIPVYAGPSTHTTLVAYLVDYAPRLESQGEFHRIAFPDGNSGWVSHYVTLLSGPCNSSMPVVNNPGDPPAAGCSVVPAVQTLLIYYGSGIIGHLGNFAPVIRYWNGRFQIAIKGWQQEAWVNAAEVNLVGDCAPYRQPPTATWTPIPPSPTWTPVPPSPTWTPTPGSPLDDLPRIVNPGIPPQDQCAVVVNQGVPAPVYLGSISITGPIAVLENYAFVLNIIDNGYVIPLTSSGRQGWVSATDAHLKGDCSMIVPFDPS
jgi:hypothetical protein